MACKHVQRVIYRLLMHKYERYDQKVMFSITNDDEYSEFLALNKTIDQ